MICKKQTLRALSMYTTPKTRLGSMNMQNFHKWMGHNTRMYIHAANGMENEGRRERNDETRSIVTRRREDRAGTAFAGSPPTRVQHRGNAGAVRPAMTGVSR